MARADTYTLISLDDAAKVLGIDPWHFNGIYTYTYDETTPYAPSCPDNWLQHDWQGVGKISRDTFAFALKEAEMAVAEYLGFYPLPQWIEEEQRVPTLARPELYSPYNAVGDPKTIQTQWKHVMDVGRKKSDYIATPTVAFHSLDGDTFNEISRITFATDVTDPEELRFYYPGKSGADSWEIRTIRSITITGGAATVDLHKYGTVLENLLEALPTPANPHLGVEGDDDTNFLQTIDVYRVWTDPSEQITYYYEPTAVCSSAVCDLSTATGCLFIREKRLGFLAGRPATWDETTETYDLSYHCYPPYRIDIYYRAGLQDRSQSMPTRQMEPSWLRMITYYAATLLDTELCGCANTNRHFKHMTEDLSLVTDDKSHNFPWDALNNPLGPSRVALLLWKRIQREKIE